jgi:predicted DNA-binding transcriptional regulator YafY
MSNLHRIQWIDAQIRVNHFPNCRDIAEAFEISTRQASRDVEYLRYSMGAPVEYSTEKNGYYYTSETYSLPVQIISDEEKKALNYLAYRYSGTGEQTSKLAELFSRLTGNEPRGMGYVMQIPIIQPGEMEAEVFQQLSQAAELRQKVKMTYLNARNESSERLFHPYKLFTNGDACYVVGYCELKVEIRVFRLDRIVALEVTKAPFTVVHLFRENDYGSNVPFNYKEPYRCRIRFEHEIRGDRRLSSFTKVEGTSYEAAFYKSEDILNQLLSQPIPFTILSPNWFKDMLQQRLQKLLQRNDD